MRILRTLFFTFLSISLFILSWCIFLPLYIGICYNLENRRDP